MAGASVSNATDTDMTDQMHIVAFREAGLRPQYTDENLLIRVGHVGISLDGGRTIYGMRPLESAVDMLFFHRRKNARSRRDLILLRYLRERNVIRAGIYDDTAIYHRAWELGCQGAPTEVWQMTVNITPDQYQSIRNRLFYLLQHRLDVMLWYSFPPRRGPMPAECDNCATWATRLARLPAFDPAGHIRKYLRALHQQGTRWYPDRFLSHPHQSDRQ